MVVIVVAMTESFMVEVWWLDRAKRQCGVVRKEKRGRKSMWILLEPPDLLLPFSPWGKKNGVFHFRFTQKSLYLRRFLLPMYLSVGNKLEVTDLYCSRSSVPTEHGILVTYKFH
jgi:hypothetical protein